MVSQHLEQKYSQLNSVNCIPYSRKAWQVENLANLANHLQFTKLKSSKLVVTINKSLADLFICQTFFCQTLEKSKFAKLSWHMVVASLNVFMLHVTCYAHIHACHSILLTALLKCDD